MKKLPSLAAGSVSNRLAETTSETTHSARFHHWGLDMHFIGRHCTRNGERSGGYVITGSLPERYDYQAHRSVARRQLRKGYTQQTKLRAIQAIIDELAGMRTLNRHRDQVYHLADSRDLDLDQVDRIAAIEGRSIVYDRMSIADCEFWKIELAKFRPLEDRA